MKRSGVAMVWVLVVLGTVSLMSFSILGQLAATSRRAEARLQQVQMQEVLTAARLLAREQLQHNPAWAGETKTFLPGYEAKISVKNGEIAIELNVTTRSRRVSTIQKEFPAKAK